MPLSADKRVAIVEYAKTLEGTSHEECDCSHFVYKVFNHFLPKLTYMPSASFLTSTFFVRVSRIEVQPADLILWDGHIAIAVTSGGGQFIGSQTSTGVAIASMSNPYWKKRKVVAFLSVA